MHAIGEVAVKVSGRAEHCLIPIRLTPIGVRAGVAFTRIRLDLGDLNGYSAIVIGALKDTAENFRCDIEYVAREKPAVRQMKSSQQGHLVSVSTPSGDT
jgi:hypothetical protein